MRRADETYLGDGLYASHDGYQVILRAPRERGDHYVALEPAVLVSFVRWARAAGFAIPDGEEER